ncbi:MAG: hypothetical protein RIR70_942 [Pseudomonadota bacterium]
MMLMSAASMKNERGLTMLEMLLVLAMLGLMASMGVAWQAGRDERLLDRAMQKISEDIRAARREAQLTGRAVWLEIAADPRSGVGVIAAPLPGISVRFKTTRPGFHADGSAHAGDIEVAFKGTSRTLEIRADGGLHVRG